MTFAEADRLMWEILRFLWTCPSAGKQHPYRLFRIRDIQENVMEALGTGQYVLLRDENNAIKHFICYWLVKETDIPDIIDGIKPVVRNCGDKMYICEHGNKGGRQSLTRMIQELRKVPGVQGVFWHNWNRQRHEVFLNQRSK